MVLMAKDIKLFLIKNKELLAVYLMLHKPKL